MRDRLCILLVACTLILGSVISVSAVTNHNLEWRIVVGDQFHYRYTGDIALGTTEFYMEIDSLPIIPSNVTSYYEFVFSSAYFSTYYENGTEIFSYIPVGVMPIGNWPLVQELVNDTAPAYEIQWINTTSEWGISYTEDHGTLVRTNTIKFSKTDGVMNFNHVADNVGDGPTTTTEITRIGFPPTLIPYMYIG
ncbi:MAG: hypothetical protein ACXABN_14520, partial [Candidatus Thorarchaeota archaeon]